MENKHNLVEDELISASIDESSEDNNSDHESISTDALKYILYGRYVHPDINARDSRLKIRDHIRQGKSDWKGA